MMRVVPDMSRARAYLGQLEKRDLPRVIGRSLQRTGNSARSTFSRRLRERLALKKVVVDAGLRIRRSNEVQTLAALDLGRAWFELVVTGKPIPLRDFNARVTRRGVTYQVSRGRGRRLYLSLGQPGFILPRFGGHVFVRKGPEPPGKPTIGIRKVFGPSLPQYLKSKPERVRLIQSTQQFWAVEVERNARFALRRRGTL